MISLLSPLLRIAVTAVCAICPQFAAPISCGSFIRSYATTAGSSLNALDILTQKSARSADVTLTVLPGQGLSMMHGFETKLSLGAYRAWLCGTMLTSAPDALA